MIILIIKVTIKMYVDNCWIYLIMPLCNKIITILKIILKKIVKEKIFHKIITIIIKKSNN